MNALDIRIEGSDESVVVRLIGEFDLAGVRDFHRVVSRVQDGTPESVCVDLTELTFLGATGLRALLDLEGRARRDGFALTVIKGPRHVQREFEMTGVDRRLTLIEQPIPR